MSSATFTYAGGRSGSYEVRGGMVHVTTEFGTKGGMIGGLPLLVIARMLARELMQASKLK